MLALLGDRVLDLLLYEQMFRKGHVDEGVMTQHRSMVVANANLARCAEKILVPHLVSQSALSTLSQHEKGTAMEAYIGAIFEDEGYTMTPIVRSTVACILDELRSAIVFNEKLVDGFAAKDAIKKYKPVLLELLQKKGIKNGASFFHTRSLKGEMSSPPFVATFEPQFSLLYCGLPDMGPISGDTCNTKKEAEESVSKRVLEYFQNQKSRVSDAATDQNVSSTSDPVSSTTALPEEELEEGEERLPVAEVELKRRLEGEMIRREILESKARTEKKRREKFALYGISSQNSKRNVRRTGMYLLSRDVAGYARPSHSERQDFNRGRDDFGDYSRKRHRSNSREYSR